MESYYTGELNKGDMIAIASGSYLSLGFYLGLGSAGNIQYYDMYSISKWFEKSEKTRRKVPYVCYINSYHTRRIVKYSPEFLTEQCIKEYEQAIEALKLLKIKL
jgi:hypothetical protein